MEAVFLSFLNAGVMASWTVLAVLLLRQLCRRCPRKIVVLFWLPVGFRFLIPASLPSPLSIFNLLRSSVEANDTALTVNQYVPADIGMREIPQVSVGIGSLDEVVSVILPAAEPAYSANPMQIWTAIGTWVWAAGMVVMLIWAIVRYVLLRRKLRFAVPVEGQSGVYTGEMVGTPFLTGLFRPRIYLPQGMDEGLTDTVLRHERAHIRCWDPVWKLAAYLVLTVHWYNPLCWGAAMLFSRDLETRCDEAVLTEVDAKTYGMALVTLAAGRRFSPVSPLAFGESSVGSRVKHILRWRKPARWAGILAGVAVIVLTLVCCTDAVEEPIIEATDAVVWETILNVSISTTPANRQVYDTFPPAVADILTAIKELPDTRREQVTDKDDFFLGQPEPMPGFIHMDIKRTGQVLSMVSLYVTAEDTMGVRHIDHYSDDTQVTQAFFTITDKKIAAAILAYCDSLQDKETATIEEQSATALDLDNGSVPFILQTEAVDYEKVPSIHIEEGQIIRLQLDGEDTLTVQEHYYVKMNDEATMITSTIHELPKEPDGMYSLSVQEHNPGEGENILYYVQHGEGRYVFRVVFDKDDFPVIPIS